LQNQLAPGDIPVLGLVKYLLGRGAYDR